MATTVQELINYLSEIEDKEQPVIYQYYLAEHFSTTPEIFAEVAEELDSELPDDYQAVVDVINEHTPEEEEED